MKKFYKDINGITIISLIVTVIILIIIASVSINMILGENGILKIAKNAKENTELAQIKEQEQLNILYEYLEQEEGTEGDISYDAIAKLNEFKKKIADYIEEAGGIKPEYTANVQIFGESIKGIVKEVTKDATANKEDIIDGKTAWVNGQKITGTNTGDYFEAIYISINDQFPDTSIYNLPRVTNEYNKISKIVDKNILSIIENNKILVNKNCTVTICGKGTSPGGIVKTYVRKNGSNIFTGDSYGMVTTVNLNKDDYIQIGFSNTERYWNAGIFTIIAWT